MKPFFRNNVWFLLFTFLFVSCLEQDVCEEVTSMPLRIGFYQFTEGERKVYSLDSLTVFGLGSDSIIYDNTKTVSRIEVPLDANRNETGFVLNFPAIPDTIWFTYRNVPNLVSMDCGFSLFYEIETVRYSGSLIDTVVVEFNTVTNSLNEHIKVFPLVFDNF